MKSSEISSSFFESEKFTLKSKEIRNSKDQAKDNPDAELSESA
jgi:hypothetical protein